MARKRVDRRVQRTRGLLQQALIALIEEKGYDATTVQDIIDRANVGRATFYAHFPDKENLLVSGVEDLREHLKARQEQAWESASDSDRGLAFSLPMLEHAKSHWKLHKAMLGKRSGTVVVQHMQRMLADLVRDDVSALGFSNSAHRRDLVVQLVTGAFMGVLIWWLDHAPSLSPGEVDELFRRLVMKGLGRELGRMA